jgi:TFIIH basal transcription factor complex TTD-A subunit
MSSSSNLLLATNSRLLTPGLLIECDPSIKAMILKYDEERHDYIVEDLDDENHLVIKESQLQNLKARLDQVWCLFVRSYPALTIRTGPRREDHAAGGVGVGVVWELRSVP